ncbi:hypothetical protein HNR46_002733 [Haloferula luteola]|uniref:Uncharacterized protein n=1 Tax=Haloferula luteola TaxID=595692 RepID=A0A840V2G0_9BACT|nr:thrombospondin type 3 repeat-containing protein [Haloferula luteola]MBB5352487.1 hypothetical protein [Haloferula luteola]
MKRHLTLLASLLGWLATPVLALPATRLPSGEWSIPAENGGLVLIDGTTGQIRRALSNGSGKLDWSKPIRTYLAAPSDVTGGLDGTSGERIALANPWTNRVAMVEIDDPQLPVDDLILPHLGPAAVGEIRPTDPELLLASVLEGGGSGALLNALTLLPDGGKDIAQSGGFARVSQLEPLFETVGGPRIAVGRFVSSSTKIFLARRSSSSIPLTIQADLTGDWQIAPSILGDDGRTLVAAWQTGGKAVMLYTLSGGIGAASTLTLTGESGLELAGGIGAIQRVEIPGATDGLLAVSADGSEGVLARVIQGKELVVIETFTPTEKGLRLNGLVPIQGQGIVQLDGLEKGGPSEYFTHRRWNGSTWEIVHQDALPELLETGSDFATLFYFDGEPFLTDTASLLGLDILPDWTTGSTTSPFPATVTGERYLSASTGLGNPTSRSFSAPSGAGYVLANQHEPTLSISALRSNDEILTPSLTLQPPSGSSPTTIEVSALYDASRFTLYYRDSSSSSSWEEWPGSLAVTYTSTWYFYLRDKVTGVPGPVSSRQWTVASDSLATTDSDADGVPDFVEAHAGLDPFGGADSDGDGVSDLEELLQGSLPNDATSLPSPRNPLPQGEGIQWLAAAFTSVSTTRISAGEMIEAHDLTGSLLASHEVENVTHPTLGSQRAAELSSRHSPSQTEWAALSTAAFFHTGVTPADDGREIIRLVPIPQPSGPEIPFTPSGSHLANDATLWITTAQAAYASWSPVSELTDMRPVHTMEALLGEAMLFDRLTAGDLLGDPAPPLEAFTAFPWRSQDASRLPVDRSMTSPLASAGYDFSQLIEIVEAGVEAADANAAHLRTATQAVYQHHLSQFPANPALPHPFAALRTWIATGNLPDDYAGVVTGAIWTGANAAIATIRGQSAEAFRPMATWAVEVLPQGSSSPGVVYRPLATSNVALLRSTGEPFLLEQGMGIVEGTTLSVTGFTDVTSPTGLPALEVTGLVYQALPGVSARDQDANLLDDEWERFFFGITGHDPFSVPMDSSFTLLEHYLAGSDPRGGSDPPGTPAVLALPELAIAPANPGEFTIDFTWPDEYFDAMDFIVEGSPDMSPGSFVVVPGAVLTSVGPDLYRITLPVVPEAQMLQFYRVRLTLAE